MNRLDIINFLIEKKNLKNYLEIGVFTGDVLNNCIAINKTGVDPVCNQYGGIFPIHCEDSNEYFNKLDEECKFDLVFIDGLHVADQVFEDIVNSIKHLSNDGYIVLHDCIPDNEHNSRSYLERHNGSKWNGDVYIGYIDAIKTYNIEHYTVDTDEGCGILIPRNINLNLERQNYSKGWNYFEENKKELINVISVDEFKLIFRYK